MYRTDNLHITPKLRQELIKYYDSGFKDYSESIRLRSRFRIKFYYPLDSKAQHGIAAYSEQLFSVSQSGISNEWGNFRYSDSRFSLYYRSEEHTSELQSRGHLVCRLLLDKKK